jgi:uncharacterized protein YcbX
MLYAPDAASAQGAVIHVRVWDDTFKAIDQGEDAAEWFSSYLNKVSGTMG